MELKIDKEDLVNRFMKYVTIDTQSDPESTSFPSTEKQKDLSRLLYQELQALGIDVEVDGFGQVYGLLPSNSAKRIPTIAFFAHLDTAPDASGTGVKPILHRNYDGRPVTLPDDMTQTLSTENSPYLKNHVGKDIITASGTTLLGADDKSGIAAIMAAASYLKKNPQIKHGDVRIVFNPDEEVGRGTVKIDLEKLNADFAYTLDGSDAGTLAYQSFNADKAVIRIRGVAKHPGYAKGKMVNAIKVAAAVLEALPKNEWSPETTDELQGFVHPTDIKGELEESVIEFIVRDFTHEGLSQSHKKLEAIMQQVISKFPGVSANYNKEDQYRNMKDIVDLYPQVVSFTTEAIERTGIKAKERNIRGGTDGSRLSHMGLPCPNIFTGMQNIHSRTEWIGVEDMAKAAETIVHLAMIWEEKGEGVKTPPRTTN